jgi:hypothetical protein
MCRASAIACLGLLLASRTGAQEAPPKLAATDLVAAFMTNEAHADEHYAGKVVEVTGILARVSRSKHPPQHPGPEDYVVELLTGDAGHGDKVVLELLLAFDASARKQLAELKPRQTITVRGECSKRILWAAPYRSGEKDYSGLPHGWRALR